MIRHRQTLLSCYRFIQQHVRSQDNIIATTPMTTKNHVCCLLQHQRIRSYTATTTKIQQDQQQPVVLQKIAGVSLQASAGPLWNQRNIGSINQNDSTFIPQIDLSTTTYSNNSSTTSSIIRTRKKKRRRVLVLCTGGTMTMIPDPNKNNALSPKQGTLYNYIQHHIVPEMYTNGGSNSYGSSSGGSATMMNDPKMDLLPDIVLHEYVPFLDSSDLGPDEFVNVAQDIITNYYYFDGFVVITGTDTMSYFATAVSFMIENLGKPIVFTGSQIPLCYPYNDARHNIIMSLLFASRGGDGDVDYYPNRNGSGKSSSKIPMINEVTIFFHDRLLRANRTTKINTNQLMAFHSPNFHPLATIGINITDHNTDLLLPPPQGPIRLHTDFDTRILTLRLIPGFDDAMIIHMIERNIATMNTSNNDNSNNSDLNEKQRLKGLVLQLYGTGNMPSVKQSFIDILQYAKQECNIIVVATTQCMTGSVQFAQYAVGRSLQQHAGVLSAYDMTTEATVYKLAYLLGRQDLSTEQIESLMNIPLRGEMTIPSGG